MEKHRRKTELTTLEYIMSRGAITTRIKDVITSTGMSKASALYALKTLEADGIIIPVSITFNSANYVHKNFIDEYNKKHVSYVEEKTVFWDFVFKNMRKISVAA